MSSYAFCLLLLGTFANCEKPIPHYLQAHIDINDVITILSDQIKSMDGQIPLLNDSRRFYAELVHVIYYLGESQSSCLRPDYKDDYQSNINQYLPEALKNPQVVVDALRKHTNEFLESTRDIRRVIEKECFPESYGAVNHQHPCDAKVQKVVDGTFFPKEQVDILFAAGKASKSFLARQHEFLAASKAYSMEAYIINGVSILKEVVMHFADYLREAHKNQLGARAC